MTRCPTRLCLVTLAHLGVLAFASMPAAQEFSGDAPQEALPPETGDSDESSDERRSLVVPPYSDLERREHFGVWPLWSSDIYDDGLERTNGLLGLYRSEERPNGDFYHRVLPFYSRRVEDGGRDTAFTIYPLLWSHGRAPDSSHDWIIPFFATWQRGPERDTLLWPLFHHATKLEGPGGSIPALWGSASWELSDGERPLSPDSTDTGGSQTRLGLPYVFDLWQQVREGEHFSWQLATLLPWGRTGRAGLPLVRQSRLDADHWHAHIFPLFGAGARGDETSYVWTPFFGSWSGPEQERGLALPWLLSWWSDSKLRSTADILAPIYHHEREGDTELGWLFPLWGHYDDSEVSVRAASLAWLRVENRSTETRNDFLPLLGTYWKTAPDQTTVNVLWPLVHFDDHGETHSRRFWPFWDAYESPQESSFGLGLGLWRHREKPAEDFVRDLWLFGLGYNRNSVQGSTHWALPLWIAHESRTEDTQREWTFTFPSIWHRYRKGPRDEYQSLHIWPFYGRSDTELDGGAERRRMRAVLAPLFLWRTRTINGSVEERHSTLHAPWPLFRRDHSQSGGSATRITPLLTWVEDDWRSSEWYDWLLHLVHVSASDSKTLVELFPGLFQYKSTPESLEVSGLLSLIEYERHDDYRGFHALPFVWYESEPEESTWAIWPLTYQRDAGPQDIDYGLFRRLLFVWHSQVNEDEAYDSILWKLAESSRDRHGNHDFRILHRLFVHRDVDGQSERVLNPFFSTFRDERTGRSHWSILSIVWRSSTADGVTTRRLFGIPVWTSGE